MRVVTTEKQNGIRVDSQKNTKNTHMNKTYKNIGSSIFQCEKGALKIFKFPLPPFHLK